MLSQSYLHYVSFNVEVGEKKSLNMWELGSKLSQGFQRRRSCYLTALHRQSFVLEPACVRRYCRKGVRYENGFLLFTETVGPITSWNTAIRNSHVRAHPTLWVHTPTPYNIVVLIIYSRPHTPPWKVALGAFPSSKPG
jgi:hypothetical protein